MSENSPLTVVNDLVVTMDYRLVVDGETIEDSKAENGEAIQFIQGAGHVLEALEGAIAGMTVGDRKHVTIQPEDGYGVYDEEAVEDVPSDEFPKEIPLEAGVELQMQDTDGDYHYAVIDSVEGDVVHLNFNHPLAGKVLEFDVHIIGLRTATPEEMEHGHVHFGDDHDHDEE